MTAEVAQIILTVVVIVLIGMPIVGTVATAYLWQFWFRDRRRPRSWVLAMMAGSSTTVVVVGLPLAWLALRRLIAGQPALDPLTASIVVGFSLAVLESIPVVFVVRILAERHRARGWDRRENP